MRLARFVRLVGQVVKALLCSFNNFDTIASSTPSIISINR